MQRALVRGDHARRRRFRSRSRRSVTARSPRARNAVSLPDDMRGLRVRITASRLSRRLLCGARRAAVRDAVRAKRRTVSAAGTLDAQEGSVATFAATRLDALGLRDVTLAGWRRGAGGLRGEPRRVGRLDGRAARRSSLTRRRRPRRSSRSSLPRSTTRRSRRSRAATSSLLRLTASGRAAFAAAARPTYDKWAAVAGEELVRAAESAVKAAPPP